MEVFNIPTRFLYPILILLITICFCDVKTDTVMDRIVSYDEILEISKNGGAVIIDVREPEEIKESGLIPKSINIPLKQVEKELSLSDKEFLDKHGIKKPDYNAYIIVTCRSGRRAEVVMNDLLKLGYKNTKYYAGSWLEWESKQ